MVNSIGQCAITVNKRRRKSARLFPAEPSPCRGAHGPQALRAGGGEGSPCPCPPLPPLPPRVPTWAVGPVAGAGLGGRAGVAAGPRALLAAAAAGDAAQGPRAPVALTVNVICAKTKVRRETRKQKLLLPKKLPCGVFY